MKLPNASRARVDKDKILNYLLCREHPDGGSKARFFERFGFDRGEWELLADALRRPRKTMRLRKWWKRATDGGTLSAERYERLTDATQL